MHRLTSLCALAAGALLAACAHEAPTTARAPGAPSFSSASNGASINVVNVSRDTTSQNETPLAVNPANPANMITGNNDWNYNDGCGVNATFDGGKTWTPTLPNGFIPGITAFTNDPTVPGTGTYDFGGDPAVAFSPDGGTAYFTCFGYKEKMSRSGSAAPPTAAGPGPPVAVAAIPHSHWSAHSKVTARRAARTANSPTMSPSRSHTTGRYMCRGRTSRDSVDIRRSLSESRRMVGIASRCP